MHGSSRSNIARPGVWISLAAIVIGAVVSVGCSGDSSPDHESSAGSASGGLAYLAASPSSTPGTTAAEFSVAQGAATYTIPIRVPPGTNGMQPSLALSYSSQGGESWMGPGWSISGLSSITRCSATFAHGDGFRGGVHLDADDRFCLDGQRLVEVSLSSVGSSRGAAKEFRTEIESFSRILAFAKSTTEPNLWRWTVETKAGMISTFEPTATAVPALSFPLAKVADRAKNTMTYQYTGADNERLLSSIVYTTNPNVPSLTATQKVEFVYEAKPEGATTGWLAGRELKSSQRLRTLKVYATLGTALTPVREYRLAYATGRTQLTSVQECGADDAGGRCYAPVRLVYGSDNFGYATPQTWGTAHATDTLTGDFDGDGRTDLLELKDRTGGGKDLVVSISTGTAFRAAAVWGTADAVKNAGLLKVADLNADGRADVLTIQADGVARAWLTSASASRFGGDSVDPNGSGRVWGTGFPTVGDAAEGKTLTLSDVDGDGLPDALFVTAVVPAPVVMTGSIPLKWGVGVTPQMEGNAFVLKTGSGSLGRITFEGQTPTMSPVFDMPSYNIWTMAVYSYQGEAYNPLGQRSHHLGLYQVIGNEGDAGIDIYFPLSVSVHSASRIPYPGYSNYEGCWGDSTGNATGTLSADGPGILRASWSNGNSCTFNITVDEGPDSHSIAVARSSLGTDGKPGGFSKPVRKATHNRPLSFIKQGDFDGDGLPDVAALDGATGIKMFLSRKAAFAAENWSTVLPESQPTYLSKPQDFYVADMNGDGIDDLVHIAPPTTGSGLLEVLYSNGKGSFELRPRHYFTSLLESGTKIKNTYALVDADADGRTDVIQLRDELGGTKVSVYRNTPAGLVEQANVATMARPIQRVQTRTKTPSSNPLTGIGDFVFYKSGSDPAGPQRVCKEWGFSDSTMDVGCGLATAGNTSTWRESGVWKTGDATMTPSQCSREPLDFSSPCFGKYEWCTRAMQYIDWIDCVQPVANQLGDFNGDGAIDLLTLDGSTNASTLLLGNQGLGNRSTLLFTATDSLGSAREVTYGRMGDATVPTSSSLSYPVAYSRSSTMIPTRVRESTGSSANPWRTTTLSYAEPKIDVSGRGFLGFAKITQSDADTQAAHATSLPLKTVTLYSQTFPHTFAPYSITKGIGAPGETNARIYSESRDTLATLTSAWGRPFPYVSTSEIKGRDLDGTPTTAAYVPRKVTTNTFDTYGNLKTSLTEWFTWNGTAYAADGYKKTVTNTYKAADLSAWIFDRVSKATQQSVWTGGPALGLTRTTAFEYAASGALTKEIVEPDAVGTALRVETEYFYDSFGNKVRSVTRGLNGTVAESRAQSVRYDAQGRFPTSRVNALGHNTSDLPDDTLGFTAREEHDAIFGDVVRATDVNGLVSTVTLDAMGRKAGELKPDGSGYTVMFGTCPTTATGVSCPSTAKVYARTQNRDGSVGTVYQDLRGREIRRTTLDERGAAIIVDTAYDRLGRTLTVSRPYRSGETPLTRKTSYDALSRVVQTTEPDGKVAKTEFHGLRIDAFDLLGRKTSKWQNSQGKTVRVTDARLKEASYEYDGFENLVRTVDPAGNAMTISYDIRGRKDRVVDPDSGEVRTTFNAFGEVLTEETAKLRAAGQKRAMSYDKLGRMISRTELATDYGSTTTTAQAVTTWSYDTGAKGTSTSVCRGALARRSTLVAGVQGPAESWTFDDKCRVASETKTAKPTVALGTVSQTYDSVGRVSRVTYPSGLAVENGYGTYGHLQKVFDVQAPGTPYWTLEATDADGNAIREKLGNGLYTHREFERTYGRLSRVYAQLSATAVPTSPLHHMTFSFDAVGNLQSKFHAAGALTEAFGYDELNRLTTVTQNGGVTAAMAVAYDDIGNITSKTDAGTYAYPTGTGAVRPHAVTSTTKTGTSTVKTDYTYDEDGNLLESKIGTTVQRRMTWNSFGKAKTITRGSASVSLAYDGDHERLSMVEGTATTYYWLSSRYERYDLGGVQTHRHYIHAGPLLVGMVSMQGTGAPVARYFHHDHLGSVVSISDTATNPGVVHQSYDAHGRRRNVNGTYATTVLTSAYRPGFAGHEMLDSVGLVNMHARLYDPLLGRFVSPDPSVQYPDSTQGFNRYTYANNNPASYFDPHGYGFFKKLFRILAVVVAIVLIVFMPVVLAALTPYLGAWGAAVAFGAMTGALLGFASTGTLRGAAMGALQGALMAMAGNVCPTGPGNWFLHGLVGGAMSSIQGGDFKSGFVSGAFAAAATHGMNSALKSTSDGVRKVMNFAGTTVIGGVSAELAGGDFKTGATTAAYGYLFNQAVHETREYLDARDYQARARPSVTSKVLRSLPKSTIGVSTAATLIGDVLPGAPHSALQLTLEARIDVNGPYIRASASGTWDQAMPIGGAPGYAGVTWGGSLSTVYNASDTKQFVGAGIGTANGEFELGSTDKAWRSGGMSFGAGYANLTEWASFEWRPSLPEPLGPFDSLLEGAGHVH